MVWRIRQGQVVVSLQGGLGNQLFQWAFASALEDEGLEVLFDSVRCRGGRPLLLGDLVPDIRRVARPVGLGLVLAEKRGWLSDTSRLRLVRQVRSGFDPSVRARLTRASYLLGYFQSPYYFERNAEHVRARVHSHLLSMLTDEGRQLADRLSTDERSVALHVRRGDYVSDQKAAARHGALPEDYYRRALDRVTALGLTHRIWFGDDLEWIRTHLAADGDEVCPGGMTTEDGGEIALMASCASRVIANSSFSWWAGWLGRPSTDAAPVIAPREWFADSHSDADELVPAEWVRL